MPSSTANWHWKTKHVASWARTWFERELVTLKVSSEESESVEIQSVSDMEGDVEIGRRKSKLITIFDVRLELRWKGTATDGTDVSGSLTIPEVSHENVLDGVSDFTYEWKLSTSSSPAVEVVFKLAKSKLPALLEAKLREFPQAILDTHGRDVIVSGAPDDSRAGTPAPPEAPKAYTPVLATNATTSTTKSKKAINTATVRVEGRFMASADDLFSLLTNEARIPAWSRAPAQSKAEVGSSFTLFGGGVKGKFTAVEPPSKFEQSWALNSPSWPDDHYATLTTELDQQEDSTKLVFTLKGVPKGIEDEIERNIEGYYVRGLKSIGYVQVEDHSLAPPRGPRHSPTSGKSTSSDSILNRSALVGLFLAGLVLAFSFVGPRLSK